jgi:biopolymer transport protein ExbB
MKESFGLLHFLSQGDFASCTAFFTLLCMSLCSWYLIAWKGLSWYKQKRVAVAEQLRRQQVRNVDSLRGYLDNKSPADAFALVAQSAVDCCSRLKNKGPGVGFDLAQAENLVAVALRQKQAEEMVRREKGLTVLASVASCSPFVGLFGTVWGIYHALLSVGQTGQATLDNIAGPVGEALIMTAFGLVVAIPALLAYNTYVRANRHFQDTLEAWASEVLILLATDCDAAEADCHVRSTKPSIQKVA